MQQEREVPMEEKLFKDFAGVSRDAWLEKITTDLKGKPLEGLNWEVAGLAGGPVYTKEDLPEQLPQVANIHPQPETFGARHWVNYQLIEVITAKEANKKALNALNNGAEGLIFRLSQSVDLKILLADINLSYCHVSFEDQTENSELLNDFNAYVNSQKISQVQGYFQGNADISASLSALKDYKLIHIDITDFGQNLSPVQELALTLSKTALFFDQLTEKGHTATKLLRQTQFQLKIGTSYFTEIAKYRAMRALWKRFASAYEANLTAADVSILAKTGNWTEAIDDPHSYMLRATTEAMSTIIGGTDALCIQPFYNVFETTQQSLAERAARNISNVLKEESYLNKVVDPSAGAYFIESMTSDITEQAWQLFVSIEAVGGYALIDLEKIESLTSKSAKA